MKRAVGLVSDDRSAVGYVRVSTTRQDKSGLSIDHQHERLQDWSKYQRVGLSKVYEDGAESAKDLKRPEVQEIIAKIERDEVSHLVVYKLDRLTRSLRDLDYLMNLCVKHGTALVSITENLDTSTATGRAMVNIIGVFAQWEREQIQERTQAALDTKRARGEKLGGFMPYGSKVVGSGKRAKLQPHPAQQAVLRSLVQGRAKGRGYKEMAEELNAKGVRPARGKKWYASSVRAVCLRAAKGPSGDGDQGGSRA